MPASFAESGIARFEPTGEVLSSSLFCNEGILVVLNSIAVILDRWVNSIVTSLPLIRLDSDEIFLFTGGTENGCQVS